MIHAASKAGQDRSGAASGRACYEVNPQRELNCLRSRESERLGESMDASLPVGSALSYPASVLPISDDIRMSMRAVLRSRASFIDNNRPSHQISPVQSRGPFEVPVLGNLNETKPARPARFAVTKYRNRLCGYAFIFRIPLAIALRLLETPDSLCIAFSLTFPFPWLGFLKLGPVRSVIPNRSIGLGCRRSAMGAGKSRKHTPSPDECQSPFRRLTALQGSLNPYCSP